MNYPVIGFICFILLLSFVLYKTNTEEPYDTKQALQRILPDRVKPLFKHTHYINLEHRVDRKRITERELHKLGIDTFERFNALTGENGHIGCSRSHLAILKQAKQNKSPYVTIVEDDIYFKRPQQTIDKLDSILKSNHPWDVIILGGVGGERTPLDSSCSQAKGVSSTTGYIVHGSYLDTLIDHWEKGLNKLEADPDKHPIYALDQTWKQLQDKDQFLIVSGSDVVQRSDFSDIQGGFIDWTNYF